MNLEQRLRTAFPGLTDDDFGHHATDLYVRGIPKVWDWLRKHYTHASNIRAFVPQSGSTKSDITGELRAVGVVELWLDIPFAGNWHKGK